MAVKNQGVNITQSFVSKLEYGENRKIWDAVLKGFGIRVHKSGASYFLNYRDKYNKQQYYTIARTNEISLKDARKTAGDLLTEIRKGGNPLQERRSNKNLKTVAELCELYLKEGCRHKKASTIAMDKSRIECHIKPLIGNEPVEAITRSRVIKLMNDITDGKTAKDREKSDKLRGSRKVSGGQGAASRTIGMLGAIMKFAVDMEIINSNPCDGIKRPADNVRDTYMTFDELEDLGLAMREEKEIPPVVLTAIRLLLLTGCRRDEVQGLKWSEVDLENQCFRFEDTKTGKQMRPFGIVAKELLQSLEHNPEQTWVFPSRVNSKLHITDTLSPLKLLAAKAGIKKNITVHTARHTISTLSEYEDILIAPILGHSNRRTTTSLYRHNPNPSKVALEVADDISRKIADALDRKPIE